MRGKRCLGLKNRVAGRRGPFRLLFHDASQRQSLAVVLEVIVVETQFSLCRSFASCSHTHALQLQLRLQLEIRHSLCSRLPLRLCCAVRCALRVAQQQALFYLFILFWVRRVRLAVCLLARFCFRALVGRLDFWRGPWLGLALQLRKLSETTHFRDLFFFFFFSNSVDVRPFQSATVGQQTL